MGTLESAKIVPKHPMSNLLIPGWLPKGQVGILTGEPQSGKTALLAQIAYALSYGHQNGFSGNRILGGQNGLFGGSESHISGDIQVIYASTPQDVNDVMKVIDSMGDRLASIHRSTEARGTVSKQLTVVPWPVLFENYSWNAVKPIIPSVGLVVLDPPESNLKDQVPEMLEICREYNTTILMSLNVPNYEMGQKELDLFGCDFGWYLEPAEPISGSIIDPMSRERHKHRTASLIRTKWTREDVPQPIPIRLIQKIAGCWEPQLPE